MAFVVRNLNAATITPRLKKYFLDVLVKENWTPGRNEINYYLACDPTALYLGTLNGKPVATAAGFKYECNYCHFGCYIVDKDYRDRGYGLKLTEACFEGSGPLDIYSLQAVLDMVPKYEKYFGVKRQWLTGRRALQISKVIPLLKEISSASDFHIKRCGEENIRALSIYDAAVFGYKRQEFVKELLNDNIVRVAVDCYQNIVGYAVAKSIAERPNSYKIGPVFCASLEIAKCLLKEIFIEIANSEHSGEQIAIIDFPVEVNPAANELATLLGGNVIMEFLFMSKNGLPKCDFKYWFAVTSIETG